MNIVVFLLNRYLECDCCNKLNTLKESVPQTYKKQHLYSQ